MKQRDSDTVIKGANDDEFVIKWWVEYIEADSLDREKMVKELPARIDLLRLLVDSEVDEEVKEHICVMSLMSLFDDCVDTCGYVFSK